MKLIFKLLVFFFLIFASNISKALEYSSHIPQTPKSAIIMLHGWGQDGKSMHWFTQKLNKDFPDMAIYYPTAQDRAPKGGYQWFVIPTLGAAMSQKQVYNKMMSSAKENLGNLHELINHIHQTQNIPYQNIHISGFSQGGLMALLTSLTFDEKLGKIISFSGVPLLFTKDFTSNNIKSSQDILIIQGDNDYIIPNNSYALTKETLESQGITPNLKIIKNMPHTINSKAIDTAKSFLQN